MRTQTSNSIARSLVSFLVLVMALGSVAAQAQEEDKSGTNPAVLTRSFTLNNDFRWLPNGRYYSNPAARFSQPFADGRMSLSLRAPFPFTNSPSESQFGLGDVSAKWTWVAHIDRQQGLIPSFEITAPTAHERVLGSGKWVAAPGITYARFLTPEVIVAPALVHSESFAGSSKRGRISRTDLDFYTVYKPKGQRWWITSDLAVGYDHISKGWPASWKVALGINVGKIGDAAVNISLRPGIGIGRWRSADYTFEAGISIVGF